MHTLSERKKPCHPLGRRGDDKPKRLSDYFIVDITYCSVSVAHILVTLYLWWLATILTAFECILSEAEESI